MVEKDTIFASKISYNGIFLLSEFYKFCYDWLMDESGLDVSEDKYSEKIKGESKDIDIEWTGTRKVTDYFKFEVKVTFNIVNLTKIEIKQENTKISTNRGSIKIGVKGNLVRDYQGKFETTAFKKFIREIYEKWVIVSRVEQMKNNLIGNCNEFLSQAKAYLDLEGKK